MANILAWQDYFVQIPYNPALVTLYRVSGGQDEFGNSGVFYQGVAVRKPTDPANAATVNFTPICWPRIPGRSSPRRIFTRASGTNRISTRPTIW